MVLGRVVWYGAGELWRGMMSLARETGRHSMHSLSMLTVLPMLRLCYHPRVWPRAQPSPCAAGEHFCGTVR